MGTHHSEKTHQALVDRMVEVTGRGVHEWHKTMEKDGPAFSRTDDWVRWLEQNYDLPPGHARAIVHERDKLRAARSFE